MPLKSYYRDVEEIEETPYQKPQAKTPYGVEEETGRNQGEKNRPTRGGGGLMPKLHTPRFSLKRCLTKAMYVAKIT